MKFVACGLMIIFLHPSIHICAQNSARNGAPDKLTLIYLLKSGLYEPLNQKLDNVADVLDKDKDHESYYWRAFSTFEISDPSMEANLSEWIKKFPQCSNAYAARAGYYMTVGWSIRGYGWAKDVPANQWKGMREYFLKALLDASQGLKINPRNLFCWSVLITISMHTADKFATRKFFDEALKIDPGSLEIWTSYMWSLLPRWGGTHEEMRQLADESEKYLASNQRLKVLHGYIPFDEGWTLEYNGDYESAIEKFDDALSFGDEAVFYRYRGDCYYDMKEYQEALKSYESALQLTPQDPELLRSKAQVLYTLGKLDEARLIIDEAMKINPTNDRVQQTKEFMNSNKAEAEIHSQKGRELYGERHFEDAIREYDLAISTNPDDYFSYYCRGLCNQNLGRYGEAISDYKQTITIKPGYASAYAQMASIHFQQGKYDEAISDNTEVIIAKPDDCSAYINRAFCYFRLNRIEEALSDLNHACTLGCQDACDRYNALKGQ